MSEGRKKVPVESTGGVHACEKYKAMKNSLKTVDLSKIDPELLKQYEQGINTKKKNGNKKK
jgi:hypothetical protein